MTVYRIQQWYIDSNMTFPVGKGAIWPKTDKFDSADIIAESKNHVTVTLTYTYDGTYHPTESTRAVTVPRKVIMTEEEAVAYYTDQQRRFDLGCERYNKLLRWCKDRNVEGVRKRLCKSTIICYIKGAGLVPPTDEELDKMYLEGSE